MKTMIRGHMFDFRLVCKVKIKSYANFNIPNKPSKFYVWKVLICNIFANGWSKKKSASFIEYPFWSRYIIHFFCLRATVSEV